MRVKKLLFLFAGITMLALIAVCVQFYDTNQTGTQKEKERKVLRVLAPYEVKMHQQILEEVSEEYSRDDKNPIVKFEFVPRENMTKELSIRGLAGKDKVDIVICDNTRMPELIHRNLLKELPVTYELYNRSSQVQMWSSTRGNGKYYGVPFTCDPYVLYYRKDQFEEKKLSIPKTWNELIACGQALQKTGRKSIGVAGKRPDEAAEFYRMLLYSKGGNFHGIEQVPGVHAFLDIQKMAQYHLLSEEMMNYTQEDLAREFAQGKINLMINQMSAATILRTSRISFEIGMVRVPPDVAGGIFLYGENIGITVDAGSGAWEFVQYLLAPEVSERICYAMDTLPVFSDVTYEMKKKVGMEDAMGMLKEARILEPYSYWSRMSTAIAQGVHEVVGMSTVDVDTIAKMVHDRLRVAIMSG